MAKKKGRLGKIFGAITGSPYERLLKQVDKLAETNESDRVLAKNLVKLVKITGQNYEEEKIDEEEHDLIIEAIEDVDPQNRTFGKVSKDEDSFYMGDSPEAPELNLGKRKIRGRMRRDATVPPSVQNTAAKRTGAAPSFSGGPAAELPRKRCSSKPPSML